MKQILLIILIFVTGITAFADINNVSVENLNNRILSEDNNFIIIDVRKSEDHYSGSIPGAINIPIGFIPDDYQSLPKDKDLYVICYSGKSSRTAILALQSLGVENKLYNVDGGMNDWNKYFPVIASIQGSHVKQINTNALKNLINSKQDLIIIDVRSETDYNKKHIPNALSIPYTLLKGKVIRFKKDQPIVLYCENSTCRLSYRGAETLVRLGFNDINILFGGIDSWSN